MKPEEHFHGSDLEKIEHTYHINKDDIISFSSNVNPLGISPLMKKEMIANISCIETYPDREYTSLRKSIATYANCNVNHILVGNGTSELISILIQQRKPKKALILAPTYSEYERELAIHGCESSYFELKEADEFKLNLEKLRNELAFGYDFLVICNPNNPTSTTITNVQIKEILESTKNSSLFLLIDETYIEFTDQTELYTSVSLVKDFDNIAILRGTSKFFASPGLRLGYCITGNPQLLAEINSTKNPWMIHSLAVLAGETMFFDKAYINETHAFIKAERERILPILKKMNAFQIYEPTANFVLLRFQNQNANSSALFDYLIRKNLMIRDCKTFPYLDDSFVRFCFLQKEHNDLLLLEIQNYLNTLTL